MAVHTTNDHQISAIEIDDLHFAWPKQPSLLRVSSFRVESGERVFLQGSSGSGKSTLLQLIAGVLKPSQGQVRILRQPLTQLSAAARDQFRAEHLGFVFQQFNLLPYLSVLDNVLLGCRFSRARTQKAIQQHQTLIGAASYLLDALGLKNQSTQRLCGALSVGQQQRVALARALIGQPELIVCDEPTSAIDSDQRQAFMTLLFDQIKVTQASLLFVSHDQTLAERFDRVVALASINELQS